MNLSFKRRPIVVLWQLLFILLSTTWLWAPYLNHVLSYRTALISQYEAGFEPYSWLFRLGDLLGAALLILMGWSYVRKFNQKLAGYLLLIIGAGLFLDPLIATTCHLNNGVCHEYFSLAFLIHATETTITASAIFIISVYDIWLRRRLVSIAFAAFQVVYAGLFLTQLASQDRFNTFSQYLYQTVLIVWIAWFCQDFIAAKLDSRPSKKEAQVVRYASAVWAFINGILAILIGLADIHLLGKIKGLYFAGDSAWLAQHGVVIGVIMLYLSRQLARGELRARQIFLFIVGLESLKYAVITPNPLLMLIYTLSFVALFVLRDDFDIGLIARGLKVRLKDVIFMFGSLLIVSLVSAAVLYRTNELADITHGSINHFFDYTLRSEVISKTHVKSALLAHTISAFALSSLVVIIWILFRPHKIAFVKTDYGRAAQLLKKYSASSEDYFKLWPKDKRYFWDKNKEGFIAYKIVGPIAFALADPIGSTKNRRKLAKDFIAWARARRLRVCFLPIYKDSLALYQMIGLNSLQIGSSALIDIDKFLRDTANDKWWRWQKNRASKNSYEYSFSQPPHAPKLVAGLKAVSDAWLAKSGRQERGFALGHFDEDYIQQCPIHYLSDSSGQIVAFTNQIPTLKNLETATVDLLRHLPSAPNSMPYLLFKTIEELNSRPGYKYFDLGFVPFTASKDPTVVAARVLSTGRFSARGLEQFKNKFNPQWQPNYLAYDGDLGDLSLIVVNLERLMSLET